MANQCKRIFAGSENNEAVRSNGRRKRPLLCSGLLKKYDGEDDGEDDVTDDSNDDGGVGDSF